MALHASTSVAAQKYIPSVPHPAQYHRSSESSRNVPELSIAESLDQVAIRIRDVVDSHSWQKHLLQSAGSITRSVLGPITFL